MLTSEDLLVSEALFEDEVLLEDKVLLVSEALFEDEVLLEDKVLLVSEVLFEDKVLLEDKEDFFLGSEDACFTRRVNYFLSRSGKAKQCYYGKLIYCEKLIEFTWQNTGNLEDT